MATAHRYQDDWQTEFSWCAAYTRHQHEKMVAAHLASKGIEVFLPLYASERRWSDRCKTVWSPLFPGYVFFRLAPDCRLRILETPGIHMILQSGMQLAHIPESEINAVRKLIASPHIIAPHPFLKCGERVRVTRGALEFVEGILIRHKNQYRLVISVEMLCQSVSVEVDAADVERAPGSTCLGEIPPLILCSLPRDAGLTPIAMEPVLGGKYQ